MESICLDGKTFSEMDLKNEDSTIAKDDLTRYLGNIGAVLVVALLSWIAFTLHQTSIDIKVLQTQMEEYKTTRDSGFMEIERRLSRHEQLIEGLNSRIRALEIGEKNGR